MTQPWMTRTVKSLLKNIDANKAYDSFPILADALQDADYGDAEVLAALRSPDNAYLHGPWYARVLSGDVPPAQAKESVKWLTEHAAEFAGYDYDDDGERVPNESPGLDWLLNVCDTYIKTGQEKCLNFDTPDAASAHADEMWKHYQVLRGNEKTPTETYGEDTYPAVPFRCAC